MLDDFIFKLSLPSRLNGLPVMHTLWDLAEHEKIITSSRLNWSYRQPVSSAIHQALMKRPAHYDISKHHRTTSKAPAQAMENLIVQP